MLPKRDLMLKTSMKSQWEMQNTNMADSGSSDLIPNPWHILLSADTLIWSLQITKHTETNEAQRRYS